ncbi:hypothetical protein F5Y08DRAFT_337534 [Xylaria arbuscula]|nr:hypothetical protein F5Y08DRAFT_337534 [Xylaria arbuscula]
MKAIFGLPISLASLVLAQAASPAVYVLMPSDPAMTAMSSALNTLGYSYSESTVGINDVDLGLDPRAYAILSQGSAYQNISRDNPEARFILPRLAADSQSWMSLFSQEREAGKNVRSDDVDSIRAFFADMEGAGASQLLELDLFAHDSHTQAQTWVTLCDFLGLGYSVVERLKLWRFPQ